MSTITLKPQERSLGNTIDYWLNTFWYEYGDKRTEEYPLMTTFRIPLAITLSYYFIVLYAGPRMMKHRKPFSLKPILIVYNLLLSLVNFYFLVKLLICSNYGRYLFDVDLNVTNRMELNNLNKLPYFWFYLISKYVDMLDTIFFVMRKKQSQITGLHVYHHSMVPTFGWIYFRLRPYNVFAAMFAILNTPIHTIMYAYYGLAAFGPHMQKYLWWKRYITQIQIFQFILLFLYSVYFVVYQTGAPLFYICDMFFQTTLYLILFTRFYLRTYKTVKKD